MAFVPYALTRPFLFGLDPERAHDLTMESIAALQIRLNFLLTCEQTQQACSNENVNKDNPAATFAHTVSNG